MLRISNKFTRSDTDVVIDSELHLSRTCKTSLLFAPLAVRVQAGCSAFPFYTPTKPLIRLYFKYKTSLSPKFKIIFIFKIFIIKCKFWNLHGIMNTSGLLQETGNIYDSMNIPIIEFIS